MKYSILICIPLLLLLGCSKEKSVSTDPALDDLTFSPKAGEQFIAVSSDWYWDCLCGEEWILLRQREDGIRVIVDDNLSEDERTGELIFTIDGSSVKKVVIHQEGVYLECSVSAIETAAGGGVVSVDVSSNYYWDFDGPDAWYSIDDSDEGLTLSFPRNYKMSTLSGEIVVAAGNVHVAIPVVQREAAWFESFQMVDVDGGSFLMGAQNTDAGDSNFDPQAFTIEAPVHEVSLDGFRIGMFEVTQAQWVAAMDYNPSSIEGDDLPVTNVSWNDVLLFLEVLNKESGLSYRLPTEAEWEFAARGGVNSEGNLFSGSPLMGVCGWYYSNSDSTIHKLGLKNSNELGIFDMSGNVREWCSDSFSSYSSDPQTNPTGGSSGQSRVNRGGSWTTPAILCRCTYRHTDSPDETASDLGFRIAL